MELSQLRYFRALAENGNLTRTASLLYISAPALSSSISRLERELNTPLFDRINGRMYLNDRGRVFLEAISDALNKIDAGEDSVRLLSSLNEAHISIATTNQTLWNGMITAFMQQNPNICISHQDYKLSLFKCNDLLTRYDFILTLEGRLEDENLDCISLFQNNSVMISLPQDHPLAHRSSVSLSELKNERFLFPPKGYGLNTFYYQICRDAGFEPIVVAECGYVLMSHLHQQGMGILFTSTYGSPFDPYSGSVLLKVDGITRERAGRPQAIYWDRRRNLGAAACCFRDFVVDYCAKYLQ